MIPNHIRNEIARHLGTPTIELARFLGVDPDADPGEPDHTLKLPPSDHPPVSESRAIRGSLSFEITTTCMGRSTTIECRLRYILTLDDIGEARGRPGRSISRLMFAYDVLEWRNLLDFGPATGEHRRLAHLQWVPIRLDLMLHPQLLRELQDLVENEALEVECRGKSNS